MNNGKISQVGMVRGLVTLVAITIATEFFFFIFLYEASQLMRAGTRATTHVRFFFVCFCGFPAL